MTYTLAFGVSLLVWWLVVSVLCAVVFVMIVKSGKGNDDA